MNSESNLKTVSFEESAAGKQFSELQQLRKDFDKYVSDQAARHAAEEKSRKLSEKRQFWLGVLAGIIGSTVAGLIVLAVQTLV